ncbi:MAG TPA: S8 family serine peptidase [Chloroflexia bacterium]|nr:S8 family serine peptidase [Chloroflexia bacterium]
MNMWENARSRYIVSLLSLLVILSAMAPAALPRLGDGKSGNLPAAIDPSDYVAGEVMVKLARPGTIAAEEGKLVASSAELTNILAGLPFNSASEILPGTYKLSLSDEGQTAKIDVMAAIATLQASSEVASAEPNAIYRLMVTPNDPQYVAGQQWGLTQIRAEQAWDVTKGSGDFIIAILDTGTALDHPDLEGKIVQGYDFHNNDGDPSDDEGHGTYTAGIAAAISDNGTGIAGVSWGARIMPVKVLSASGSGSDSKIAQGIRWAVDHGARIINASLGGSLDTTVMRDAARYAYDHNVLLVASAGNTPDGKPNYPAAFDTVLAVGATGRNDTFTGFSSWGPFVDVTAPGVGILGTAIDGGYDYANGTSASCPFVSGLASLVWSVNPSLTAEQVRWIIEDSSDDFGDPGFDEHYGKGRVNAEKAVRMAQQGPPPARTATPVGQPTITPAPQSTQPPTQGASLQVDSKQVFPGSLLAMIGAGFGPNELIDLDIKLANGSSESIGKAQADAQGAFRAEAALPNNIPVGKITLTASGATSGRKASVELTVEAGSPGNGGQSTVQGTVRGNLAGAVVHLKPSLGVSGAELTAQPDAKGAYSFTRLASGFYSLTVTGPGSLTAGPFSVQVDGTAADVKTIDVTLAGTRPVAIEKVPPITSTATLVYFPPVGHTLRGPFLKFWQQNGGLPVFGYPLTEEFQEISPTDGKTYTVQYFERNRFELHPEFAGTRNEVLMGLLGVEMTRGRTFPPGAAFTGDATHAYFPETRHSLSGPFLKYWQQHGGLPIFGYPISEELMENGYLVQYFERNRFEYHPENAAPYDVLLGLLGTEIMKRNGWIAP